MDLSVCLSCYNRSRMDVVQRPGMVLTPFPDTVDRLVASLAEAGVSAELIVTDYGSTDWPLAQWLPQRAAPVPVVIIEQAGRFTLGGGKNLAAGKARADILFFLETDLLVPPSMIARGLSLAREGKAYFPRYRREHGPGADTYWGSGHGCCIVRREHWQQNPWKVTYEWGIGQEDTTFAGWFNRRGMYVRADEEDLLHKWHPLWESKRRAQQSPGTQPKEGP